MKIMAFPSRIAVIFCVAFLAALGTLQAQPEYEQPHMEAALHFLQDAKKSEQPVSLLHSAKSELEKATHNKGGYRVKAIGIVDEAVAEGESGDTQKMIEKINAAIAAIHTGMYKSP